ncbi:MAG: acyl-CoA dehydrogenase family protein [Candidatus Heimdallarchaeota archaeon]|nr:acyl-CoA dehydrogenase family protein [Candidatus Heimdallarchaeota archaeon]
MLDTLFTDEHQLIRETVRDFALNRLEPVAEKMDREDYFPMDLFKELGELGLLAPTIPEKYGGADADYIAQAIILEELARISPAFALSIGAHSNLTVDNMYRNSNDWQREEFVSKIASGEWMGALALTEPGSGSDALSMKTTAAEDGDYFILNGSKTFITNASLADVSMVYAKTAPELGSKGISAFIMPMNLKGVSTGTPFDKMGMRGSKTSEVFMDDVAVPKSHLLGELNKGSRIVMSGLSCERAVLASINMAISKTVLEMALQYSKEREQFGKPISQFQMIQDKLANMYTETKASELLVYWALTEIQKDHKANAAAAASIMYAAERSTMHALDAIQILGGYGYMKEYKVEKFMRDAKLLEIGAGTTEVRKLVIAREILRK